MSYPGVWLGFDWRFLPGDVPPSRRGLVVGEPADERDPLEGLPPDLARVLRDQSIVVPQDAKLWDLLAKWQNAPSNTASGDC